MCEVILDVSLLQYTLFKYMGCYQAVQKSDDYSFESGVLEQGNIENIQDSGP